MPFIALIDVSDYKKGSVVPDEKAKLWLKMFVVPCVEFRPDPVPVREETVQPSLNPKIAEKNSTPAQAHKKIAVSKKKR
jgi:hypothetical protein